MKNVLLLTLLLFPFLTRSEETRSLLNAFNQKQTTAPVTTSDSVKQPMLPPPPPIDTATLEETTKEESKTKITNPSLSNITHAQSNRVIYPQSAEEKKDAKARLQEEVEKDQLVRFYFEDASLENVVRYMEELFKIKFFSDDDINPTPQGGGVLKGIKVTFKTNKPFTRKQAWDLFLKFLDIANLSVVEMQTKGFFRITTVVNANSEVLPVFFNTDINKIPDNSTKIRYVFFIKNNSLDAITNIAVALASPQAKISSFPDLNAIVITEKGSNIKALMQVLLEFDKEIPEAMSIIKLKKTNAQDIANLYADLTKTENPLGATRLLGQRAQPDSIYFPANVRMIVEPRTNALILLGPGKSLQKIEDFITKHVDVDLDMPYSPLYVYESQYLPAQNLADILNGVVNKFNAGSTAAQYGGVRDGDQYFGPIIITAETATTAGTSNSASGNRIIIKASERDYKKLLQVIKELDVLQPEVAIEVLILNIASNDEKNIGAQIRNKINGQPITNVNFQNSGLNNSPPVTNTNTGSLLGNLVSLASGQTAPNGATFLTIGDQINGVWAIFQLLKSYTETNVIANPFLVTTNNYPSQVSVGTMRQIQTGAVVSGQGPTASYDSYPANLTISITPQINLNQSVQMSVTVNMTTFSDATNLANGNTNSIIIQTSVLVKDREIVALGGLVKTEVDDVETKVPILGDLPLVGWLFKNKQKGEIKTNILIFISPRILSFKEEKSLHYYTLNKAEESRTMGKAMEDMVDVKQCPIDRAFFEREYIEDQLNTFLDKDDGMRDTRISSVYKESRVRKKEKSVQERASEIVEKVHSNEPIHQSWLSGIKNKEEVVPQKPKEVVKKSKRNRTLHSELPPTPPPTLVTEKKAAEPEKKKESKRKRALSSNPESSQKTTQGGNV